MSRLKLSVLFLFIVGLTKNTQITEIDPLDYNHFVSNSENALIIVYTEGSSLYSTLLDNMKSVIESHPEFLQHFGFGKLNAVKSKTFYNDFIRTSVGSDKSILIYSTVKGDLRIPLLYCITKECMIETIKNKIEAVDPQVLPEDYTQIFDSNKTTLFVKEEVYKKIIQSSILHFQHAIYICDIKVFVGSNEHSLFNDGKTSFIYSPKHKKLIDYRVNESSNICRFVLSLNSPTIIDLNFAEFNRWLLPEEYPNSGIIFVEPEDLTNQASSQLMSFSKEADKYIENYFSELANSQNSWKHRFVFFKGKYSNEIVKSLIRKVKHDMNKPKIDKSVPMLICFEKLNFNYEAHISVYVEEKSYNFRKPNYLQLFINSIIEERQINARREYRVYRSSPVNSSKYDANLYFNPRHNRKIIELNFNTLKLLIEEKEFKGKADITKLAFVYLYRVKPNDEVSNIYLKEGVKCIKIIL